MKRNKSRKAKERAIPPTLFLRKGQAAEAMGIGRRTLNDWMRRKIIPYRKIGKIVLFSAEDLKTALDGFRHRAIGEPRVKPAA